MSAPDEPVDLELEQFLAKNSNQAAKLSPPRTKLSKSESLAHTFQLLNSWDPYGQQDDAEKRLHMRAREMQLTSTGFGYPASPKPNSGCGDFYGCFGPPSFFHDTEFGRVSRPEPPARAISPPSAPFRPSSSPKRGKQGTFSPFPKYYSPNWGVVEFDSPHNSSSKSPTRSPTKSPTKIHPKGWTP